MVELVTSVEEVREAVNVFHGELEQENLHRYLKRNLATFKHWYAFRDDTNKWRFGPSKFVGYIGLTLDQYEVEHGTSPMHGSNTQKAIKNLNCWTELKPKSNIEQELRALVEGKGNIGSAVTVHVFSQDLKKANPSQDLKKAKDTCENLIFYGPPGTGKTHKLREEYLPNYIDKDENGKPVMRYEFVTFHQSYAYEDFVEGIRPEVKNGGITYKVQDGVLKRLCARAREYPEDRFALFIDEINRGNVAKIFGELITLVEADKRIRIDRNGRKKSNCKGLEVTLPYSKKPFGVPTNVNVYGTMNTADRSIALLDSALRRRFRFEELTPDPECLDPIQDSEGGEIDLRTLLKTMNDRLSHLLHRDKAIGHSYFYHVKSFPELCQVFAQEIIPLLQEAFYDDPRPICLVLADQLVSVRKVSKKKLRQLFPKAKPNQIPDGESFKIFPKDKITPDMIRKIYKKPQ